MISINKKQLKKWIIIITTIAVLYPIPLYLFWYLMAMGSGPELTAKIKDQYMSLPSRVLINKIKGYGNPYNPLCCSPYPFPALRVLMERKEKEAVPILINFLKSRINYKRRDAIWALGVIGDERAIRPLMEIVKKGEKCHNYSDALMALSRMKYEGAFPYIVKLAKSKDACANGSIAMLKEFGKPECIPLLLEIKNEISDAAPLAKFDKSRIDDAIKHIESLQKNNRDSSIF